MSFLSQGTSAPKIVSVGRNKRCNADFINLDREAGQDLRYRIIATNKIKKDELSNMVMGALGDHKRRERKETYLALSLVVRVHPSELAYAFD